MIYLFTMKRHARVRAEVAAREEKNEKSCAELHRLRSQLGFAQDNASALEVTTGRVWL